MWHRIDDVVEFVEMVGGYNSLILACLEILANCLIIIVFFKSKLRRLHSFSYLAAVAVSDSLHLLAIILISLSVVCHCDEITRNIIEFISFFFENISGICSENLLVVFAYNRYISLKYPLHSKFSWFVRKTKAVIIAIFVASVMYAIMYQMACSLSVPYGACELTVMADFIVKSVIGSILLIILSIATSRAVSRTRYEAGRIFDSKTDQYSLNRTAQASSAMSFLQVPYEISTALYILSEMDIFFDSNFGTVISDYRRYFYFLNVFNCGIDIFIYCICGRTFRNAIREVFKKYFTRNCNRTIP